MVYTVTDPDPRGGPPRSLKHALDPRVVLQFVNETISRYRGITQANPYAPAPFKGWFQKDPSTPTDIDYLTYLFGLVRIDQSDEAVEYFTAWKQRFEEATEQTIVLVIYYQVQTIGDFFVSVHVV